jgi:Transposase
LVVQPKISWWPTSAVDPGFYTTRRDVNSTTVRGIDLHRRRSVIVRMPADGEVLEVVRIVNDPVALSLELAKAGPDPEVALEATYGWYWAADLLTADGAHVHLVHPLGLHWDARRVKNDERDATELAHRLRRGDLPPMFLSRTRASRRRVPSTVNHSPPIDTSRRGR